jgi:hypothetical protein
MAQKVSVRRRRPSGGCGGQVFKSLGFLELSKHPADTRSGQGKWKTSRQEEKERTAPTQRDFYSGRARGMEIFSYGELGRTLINQLPFCIQTAYWNCYCRNLFREFTLY